MKKLNISVLNISEVTNTDDGTISIDVILVPILIYFKTLNR